jgi:DNA repair protein RadA/Sms
MARVDIAYVCQNCGASFAKWAGRCEACGEWNTIVEEVASAPPGGLAVKTSARAKSHSLHFEDLDGDTPPAKRLVTGISELDRALGGGLVPASAVLIGGDPGIGKSTILLQAAASLGRQGARVAYVSGEEAIAQIQDRARRLGLAQSPVQLAAETELRAILDGVKREKPQVLIVDSIQTMWSDAIAAAPGTVAQVRSCAHDLVRYAKKSGCVLILVGHVTKDGQVAGPKVVEHLVDAVLYFEGERGHHFRLLRAVKNRFGGTDEIGVFEMTEGGLVEVTNPSALFLDSRGGRASGSVVFAGLEGARPVLVEIQALAAPAAYGTPRRAVVGWDAARLAMILAVLEARCGLPFGGRDVYLSVAGGLRISEPAADLAVAAALASAAFDAPLEEDAVAFGEVALSGDIRPVSRAQSRLKEAAKLGFRKAYARDAAKGEPSGVEVIDVRRLRDLVDRIAQNARTAT